MARRSLPGLVWPGLGFIRFVVDRPRRQSEQSSITTATTIHIYAYCVILAAETRVTTAGLVQTAPYRDGASSSMTLRDKYSSIGHQTPAHVGAVKADASAEGYLRGGPVECQELHSSYR